MIFLPINDKMKPGAARGKQKNGPNKATAGSGGRQRPATAYEKEGAPDRMHPHSLYYFAKITCG